MIPYLPGMYWFTLVRWKNLLIIFLTQLLAWACVILPLQLRAGQVLLLSPQNFLLLSGSTVLIAAAGYIINDYFDIKIDSINRPDKVILEKRIPLRMAIIMHTVLNIAAVLMAALVALKYSWLAMQLICTILLWLYSTSFKRRFVTGNVVVALLTALTIVTLIVYEPALHPYINHYKFIDTPTGRQPNPVWVLGIYTYFAFMLTWMREIVKDMEDYKGDAAEGCMTMPIRWGLQKSARFVLALGWFAAIPLVDVGFELCAAGWWWLGIYTLVGLALPVAIWVAQLQRQTNQKEFHKASRNIKAIMLLGIMSLVIYYLQAHG